MRIIFSYIKRLFAYWWALLTSVILALDQVLTVAKPDLAKWLDDHYSAPTRLMWEWKLAIAGFFIASALAYRDEFRRAQDLQVLLNTERQRKSPARNTRHDAIQILLGNDLPFQCLQVFPVGTKRRVIRIGLRNVGNGHISNCALHIKGIWKCWQQSQETSALLEKGFGLMPDEIRYVDVAAYDESYPDGSSSGQHITVPIPLVGGYSKGLTVSVEKNLQKSERHRVTFEVTCTDASSSLLECSLWVDFRSGARLCLEAIQQVV